MDGAKPSVSSVDLPSGFRIDDKIEKLIHFREMAGPEEDLLASKMATSAKISQLMANCTTAIGAISDKQRIRKLMDEMVITDRWFYILQLRILSLGANYEFQTSCPSCSQEDKVIFDLNNIVVTNPPDPMNLYREFTTSRGTKIRWKIATGETEAKIEKMANDHNAMTVGLYARVTEINDKPVSMNDVLSLAYVERGDLRKEIDKCEGTFDDTYDAICPKCAHEYKGELRLDIRSFFYL